MPSNNRYENQRGARGSDRDNDYSARQRPYRSGQMDQFGDTGSRQSDWSTGEDYQSGRQMGGSSGADYGRYESSRFGTSEDDDYEYGQDQFSRSQGREIEGYRSGGSYGESRFGGSSRYTGSSRSQDYSMPTRPARSQTGSYGTYESYPSGYSGDYRQSGNRWSQNAYDGRNVSRPYGASNYSRSSHEDFGSWRAYGEKRGFFERAGDEIASWFGDENAARRREQDHRGTGPSNYTRSDERIKEDANEALTRDWRVDASNVTVTVDNGEVTLNGHVPTREAKRCAEDCVEDVSGVKHVQNNLRVHNIQTSSSSGVQTHNLTSTSSSTGTGNVTTGVGTTAPGATGSTGSTGTTKKT